MCYTLSRLCELFQHRFEMIISNLCCAAHKHTTNTHRPSPHSVLSHPSLFVEEKTIVTKCRSSTALFLSNGFTHFSSNALLFIVCSLVVEKWLSDTQSNGMALRVYSLSSTHLVVAVDVYLLDYHLYYMYSSEKWRYFPFHFLLICQLETI